MDLPRLLMVERGELWARIRINRPDYRNAANLETWEQLASVIQMLGSDPAVRTVIITGAGDRAFMAGADLSEFPEILQSPERIAHYLAAIESVISGIEGLQKPVIAEINGATMGGGLELAVACDYRVAVPEARFGIPSANLGVGITFKDVERIVALVGLATARQLLLFSRVFTASEGVAKGFIDEIVAPERLRNRCEELAAELADKAPKSIRSGKYAMNAIVHPGDSDLKMRALQSIHEAWNSDELKVRINQFIQQRGSRS